MKTRTDRGNLNPRHIDGKACVIFTLSILQRCQGINQNRLGFAGIIVNPFLIVATGDLL